MLKPSRVEVTIRPAYMLTSAIVGFARVVIDKQIMLKEITIFKIDDQMTVLVPQKPIAMCPEELDINTLNDIIWKLQDVIEDYILKTYKEKYRSIV